MELGDAEGAKAAWEAAAKFGTVYYGQLARSALGQKSFELRDMPSTEEVEARFEQRELVRKLSDRPSEQRFAEVCSEHAAIESAIASRGAEAARAAMVAHLHGGIARLFGH